jgi:putative peptidoglycan lipid II flippase
MIKVLATGYYARQDTKAPVRTAMQALGLTMLLNVIVVATLWYTGHLKTPGAHTLVAVTNGVGALLNAGLLYVGLVRKQIVRAGQVLRGLLWRILVATIAMAAFLVWIARDLQSWLASGTAVQVAWLSGLVAGGLAVYFGVLWLLGVRVGQFRLQPPTLPA